MSAFGSVVTQLFGMALTVTDAIGTLWWLGLVALLCVLFVERLAFGKEARR